MGEQILERERVQLLSRFSGDRTVESRRAKRQSCSPRQELRVDTCFVEFRPPKGRVFSYLVIPYLKRQEMILDVMRSKMTGFRFQRSGTDA